MFRYLALLPIAVFFLAGCFSFPEPAGVTNLTPLEQKGWKVFEQESCFSSCHVRTITSSKEDIPPRFVPDLRKTQRHSRDWYLAYFTEPRAVLPWSPMPSYGYLSSEEMDALIAFLQRLNAKAVSSTPEAVSAQAIPETPRDLAGYASGRAIFRTYCEGCHGESGNGGGAVGHLLFPEPRDFTDAVWMSKQTERYLFSVISDGKPDTAMPAFRDTLTPLQRALLVRYIPYFSDPVGRERMELALIIK